jgi:hypothetical protein
VNLRLDPTKSTIAVRTVAEGLLARLAHDLEIVGREMVGEGSDEPATATVRIPPACLRVLGVVRDGRVNEGVLGASDRADIERRMRDALGGGEITVVARLVAGRATLEVQTDRGRQVVELTVQLDPPGPGALRVRGSCALSLRALGVPPVKGPAGAFRLADQVEVRFDASFAAV